MLARRSRWLWSCHATVQMSRRRLPSWHVFKPSFFLWVKIELHAHIHALLIPGLDNRGSHVTANVVNPSKRNLLRDLKKETSSLLPSIWHALKKQEGTPQWRTWEASTEQWHFNSKPLLYNNHRRPLPPPATGLDDARLFPHIRKSYDMSDNIWQCCKSTKWKAWNIECQSPPLPILTRHNK